MDSGDPVTGGVNVRLCVRGVILLAGMWGGAAAGATELKSESFPGADVGARVAAADARLGTAAGTITIETPGTLTTAFVLGRMHALVLRAPVRWRVAVDLAGANEIWCEGKGAILSELPGASPADSLLRAKGVSGIRIHDCTVSGDVPKMVLRAETVSQVAMDRNTVRGLTLFSTNMGESRGGSELSFRDNSVDFPKGASPLAAILLPYVKGVTASGNRMSRVMHGIQWWGGDSGKPDARLEQVTAAGGMTFTKNVCRDVGASCIWGSMGADIVMRGNSADGCGDVCFDTEGGLRTVMTENTATGCKNGCAAIFFFSDRTEISKNRFSGMSPGGGLIFFKNTSQDPARHDHVLVSENELRCEPGVCRAVYQEAVSGLRLERNQIVNGTYLAAGAGRAISIGQNHFVFNLPVAGGGAAIAAPAVIGGTQLDVSGNVVESAVDQGAGAKCIAAVWNDFNNTDLQTISGNTCGGAKPFGIAISTTTDGKNPGPRGVWVVSGNRTGGGKVEHTAVTRNEVYSDLGECSDGACRVDDRAVRTAGGCAAEIWERSRRGTGWRVRCRSAG